MQANELRIGNLVKSTLSGFRGKPLTIFGIENERVVYLGSEDYRTPIDYLKPIELTEEWLIKMGFVKEITDYDIIWVYKKFKISLDYIMYDIDLFVKIKYVHQLQNLYFALTGEELTIKN